MGPKWALIITVAALCAGLVTPVTYGQTPAPSPTPAPIAVQPPSGSAAAYTGLDIVFLVDQSGSMSGAMRQNNNGSDPNGLRFQSMQFAMSWLGDYSHYAATADSTVRMSVIAFGDPEQIMTLDWTELSPRSYTTQQWENQRDDLSDLLSGARFGNRHFGYTNFEQAMRRAQTQFDSLAPLPDGQINLRAIMVITDGEPCAIADTDAQGNCTNLAANQAQLTRIAQLAGQVFPDPQYQIYVLALEAGQQYWTTYASGWQSIIRNPNHAQVIRSANDMGPSVERVISDIFGQLASSFNNTPIPLNANGSGSIDIPPYVGRASFNVFKTMTTVNTGAAPTNTLTLTRPDGISVTGADPDITVDGNFGNIERWRVLQPAPGTWGVQVGNPAATVQLSLDESYMQMRLLGAEYNQQPQARTYYMWQSIPLEPFMYYPRGNNEIPVEILPAYPMDVQATVSDPQGSNQIVTLSQNTGGVPTNNVPFPQYTGQFVPLVRGDYAVDVVASVSNVPDPNNPAQTFVPLDTRQNANRAVITVSPVVVTMETGRQTNWLETVPEIVCVKIQDAVSRQRIDRLDVITVEAVLSQGGAQVQTVPLTYQPDTGEPCAFTGQVAPPAVGTYELTVRGLVPNAQGNMVNVFSALSAPPAPQTFTVDPIDRITLEVVEPALAANQTTSTSQIIKDRPFWQRQPLVFSVIATDQNNQPVDLAALSGFPPQQALVLEVNDGRGNVPGVALSQQTNFLFELETFELGRGSYVLNVTGAPLDPSACQCNYALDSSGNLASTLTVGINRTFPLIVLVQLGVGFLVFGGVIAGSYFAYDFFVQRTTNPLSGTLVISEEGDTVGILGQESIKVLSLDGNFNRKKLTSSNSGGFPGDLPIKSIFVTNDGKQNWYNEGKVRVTVRYTTPDKPKTFTLSPEGEPKLIHRTRDGVSYFMSKDPDWGAVLVNS